MTDQQKRQTLKALSIATVSAAAPFSLSALARSKGLTEVQQDRPEIVVYCDVNGHVSTLMIRNDSQERLDIAADMPAVYLPGGRLDLSTVAQRVNASIDANNTVRISVGPGDLTAGVSSSERHASLRYPVKHNVIVDQVTMTGRDSGKHYRVPVRLERVAHVHT